jgi:hypothetical protein
MVGGIDLGSMYAGLDQSIRLTAVTASAFNGDMNAGTSGGVALAMLAANAGGSVGGGGSGSGQVSSGTAGVAARSGGGSGSGGSGGGSGGDSSSFTTEFTSNIGGFEGSTIRGGKTSGGSLTGSFDFAGGTGTASLGEITGIRGNASANIGQVQGSAGIGDIAGASGEAVLNAPTPLSGSAGIGGVMGARMKFDADLKGIKAGANIPSVSLGDLVGELKFRDGKLEFGTGDITGLDVDYGLNVGGVSLTSTIGDISLLKADVGINWGGLGLGFNLGDWTGVSINLNDGNSTMGATKKNKTLDQIPTAKLKTRTPPKGSFLVNPFAGRTGTPIIPTQEKSGARMTAAIEGGREAANTSVFEKAVKTKTSVQFDRGKGKADIETGREADSGQIMTARVRAKGTGTSSAQPAPTYNTEGRGANFSTKISATDDKSRKESADTLRERGTGYMADQAREAGRTKQTSLKKPIPDAQPGTWSNLVDSKSLDSGYARTKEAISRMDRDNVKGNAQPAASKQTSTANTTLQNTITSARTLKGKEVAETQRAASAGVSTEQAAQNALEEKPWLSKE